MKYAIAALLFTGAGIAAIPAIPCASEDSSNCTWYGSIQGNTIGSTFTDINGHTFEWRFV